MTRDISNDHTGPVPLPAPPNVRARVRIAESLRGHTTSEAWLPQDTWTELDELRAEQLRLRGRLVAELQALRSLEERHKKEDADHAKRLRQAFRDGADTEPEDHRTSAADRAAQRAAIQERVWAVADVLADLADRVIETIRAHEDAWLADLRRQACVAEDKRRQAEQLLVEARAVEWHVVKIGQWVQATANDDALGRQPAPTVTPVPRGFNMPTDALERPWHKARAWNGTSVGGAA